MCSVGRWPLLGPSPARTGCAAQLLPLETSVMDNTMEMGLDCDTCTILVSLQMKGLAIGQAHDEWNGGMLSKS